MQNPVTLKIDAVELKVAEGTTVLEAARAHGIRIPTLCTLEGLGVVGACRLCMVEVRGVPRLLPACATRASEGMDVATTSPKLDAYRRMIVELLLAERNHVCAACVANGHCELQTLARELGVTHSRYPYRYPRYRVDASHAKFAYDPNRCVLCTRCQRVCEDIEGARTWHMAGRGIRARMATDLDDAWGAAVSCTACGKCVRVCPTGALVEKGRGVGERPPGENVLPFLAALRHSGR